MITTVNDYYPLPRGPVQPLPQPCNTPPSIGPKQVYKEHNKFT